MGRPQRKLQKPRRVVSTEPLATAKQVTPPVSSGAEVLPSYVANREKQFPFLLAEDFVEKHNIAWRVELAKEDPANPLLESQFPWESAAVFSHGTILQDPTDGLWKIWYVSAQETRLQASAERRLAYAESRDGIHWVRPELNLCPYPGYPRTNILLDIDSGGSAQHASVIVHPGASSDRRYEMFIIRLPGWECPYKIVRGFSLPEGKSAHQDSEGQFKPGLFRYKSADGKTWTPWEIAKLETSDSAWVSQLSDGSYVIYHKTVIPALPGGLIPYDIAAGVCRILVRRTSKDGSDWTLPEPVLTPDWLDSQDTQFMELTPLEQRRGYVGLVTVYHALNQSIDVQFAGSRDGKSWWRPDRRACLPLRALGDVGGGMIWPMHPLIQYEGRVYLYYSGCEGLHNDYQSTEPVERMNAANLPNWPHWWQPLMLGNDVYSPMRGVLWFHGSLCRASWEEGRLWAAVTASGGNAEGTLLTRSIPCEGKQLEVNVVTLKEGSLEAELLQDGNPVPEFSRSDCVPIRGNHHNATVRWKGGTRCPARNIQVRFYLRRAFLYGFDFQPAG